ncbi:MAG: hypothetical protein KDE09_22500, partial [Anaerolineales bacterium]|nr:hypothetical protein [Anaerolineales bacterium]
TWRGVQIFFVVGFIVSSIWVANLTRFRKFQPAPIDPDPIVEFMDKDQHWRWRYLTLGFGDQVAWLGAQMTANSVDGNYHSARRLPEMTTTPVERLEGAKFRGIPGIGSLQQFLAVPDKYNLKFIFSNDQFYDPLLYFYGWHRLVRLGNGIMVWERDGIPPLPEVLPRKEIPLYQRIMWGTVPMGALMAGLLVLTHEFWAWRLAALLEFLGVTGLIRRVDRWLVPRLPQTPRGLFYKSWAWLDEIMWNWSQLPREDANQLVKWQVWYDWLRAFPRPRPAPPTAHAVRAAILLSIVFVSVVALAVDVQRRVRDPIGQVEAYYDDLDFRRMQAAYDRLDPESRPSFDQYLLELSVLNGLVASYGKLDSIRVSVVAEEEQRMVVDAELTLVTALSYYTDTNRLELVKRDDTWYIVPEEGELAIPPDQFYRRGTVAWHSAGRRRVTTETTAFADVLDRPEIQILSSRLVYVDGRYHIVGELINIDVDPADLTVRGILFDNMGEEITWYNASLGIIHKLLPKEVTPFRITFEGVAGAAIADMNTAGEFDPAAFSPAPIDREVAEFQVYSTALVTTHDLNRDVTAQDIQVVADGAGGYALTGRLLNTGTQEATIPHVFVTYYDENDRVVWVDDYFLEGAVRTQRLQPFTLALTPATAVELLLDEGGNYANVLANEIRFDADWLERLPVPPELGYASVRVSVHYFVLTQ